MHMLKPKELYIDSEGVERGYYVYIHRVDQDGEVFYVGKGHGKRAWNFTERNHLWKEKVSSLKNVVTVEIVYSDLSELEALDIEAKLIKENGGISLDGGRLTNLDPGGDVGGAVILQSTALSRIKEWSEHYCDARKFKEFSFEEQNGIVSLFCTKNNASLKEVESYVDDELNDIVADIGNDLSCIMDDCEDLLNRRISFKDFCMSVEGVIDSIDDVESEDDSLDELDDNELTLFKKITDKIKFLYREIDSGNREEAEQVADNKVAD